MELTYEKIYEYFKEDYDLLNFFDPQSSAKSIEEAAMEIYKKLNEFMEEYYCEFFFCEYGYLFYSDRLLISFCIKPKFRTKKILSEFSDLIKEKLGDHFGCFLYNKNIRAIRFLENLGMTQIDKNNLITLLTI